MSIVVREIGPAGHVHHRADQRLVERHERIGVAPDPGPVAQRLRDRQAQRDAGVLDGVVAVHVEVALGLDGEVQQRVPGERLQHVVEEPDAGAHRASPRPSRSTRTWRSVSLVLRWISPMRGIAERKQSTAEQ